MAIDYNAGINSIDVGAHDITYSGNQGPKSPDQERLMGFDDTPGFELEPLEKLLEEVLDFYNQELNSGSDTNPSLVLAVQIYKILKTYNVNTNKFEKFFQSLNFEKNTLNPLFSSILFEDFNSIFSLSITFA